MDARILARRGATFLLAAAAACRPAESPLDRVPALPVNLQVVEHYYPVTGRTSSAILESLQRNGPDWARTHAFALTDWRVTWRWNGTLQEEACRIVGPQVDVVVDIWLPSWTDAARASRQLVAEWDSFLGALRRHELRHRDLARAGGRAIAEALHAFRAPTCTEIDVPARARARAVAEEYRRRDREYDRTTGRGRTEGVVWPVGGA